LHAKAAKEPGRKAESEQKAGGRAGGGLMVCRWYGLTHRRGKEDPQKTTR